MYNVRRESISCLFMYVMGTGSSFFMMVIYICVMVLSLCSVPRRPYFPCNKYPTLLLSQKKKKILEYMIMFSINGTIKVKLFQLIFIFFSIKLFQKIVL